MSVNCDPSALVTSAKCFNCIPKSVRRWVRAYLLCQVTGSAVAAGNFGAVVANAWALRVVANGGAMPSQSSITAVANFTNTLNNAGVWSKLLDVNIFAPDSLIACLTPVLITDGTNLWTNNGFVLADLTVNGLKGDGAAKFINTTIDPNARFATPASVYPGLSFYVSQTVADGNICEMSWTQNQFSLYSSFGGTCFFDCYGTTTGRISFANAAWTGFLSGNRVSVTNSNIYKASSTFPFASAASTAANNTLMNVTAGKHIFGFANNNGADAALQFSTRRLSFMAYHFGLSAADCQTLFNAVQAIRQAFGGGFV